MAFKILLNHSSASDAWFDSLSPQKDTASNFLRQAFYISGTLLQPLCRNEDKRQIPVEPKRCRDGQSLDSGTDTDGVDDGRDVPSLRRIR